MILTILVVRPIFSKAIVIEIRRDVTLRGLLIASLGMPSIFIGPVSASLLHFLEQLHTSNWTLHGQLDILTHLGCFCIFEDIDSKVIVLSTVVVIVWFLDELVGVVTFELSGFEVGAGGKE